MRRTLSPTITPTVDIPVIRLDSVDIVPTVLTESNLMVAIPVAMNSVLIPADAAIVTVGAEP